MYVIIGCHFVPPGGNFLLLALVIVMITLNVIVRQIKCPLKSDMSMVHKLVVKLSNTSSTFSEQVEITLSKCLRV
jgi:hypothetical protein